MSLLLPIRPQLTLLTINVIMLVTGFPIKNATVTKILRSTIPGVKWM